MLCPDRFRVLHALAFAATFAGPGPSISAEIARLDVCVNFNCGHTRTVTITRRDLADVAELFKNRDNSRDERSAIAVSIGRLEKLVGASVGTDGDLPRNRFDDLNPHQLDCIAETWNTSRYLRLLQDEGLLRWHKTLSPMRRRTLFFNTHWTAVIGDVTTGERFAVDSWFGGNGDDAFVVSLEHWLDGMKPQN
jgi:hypothetical protein